MKYYIFDIIRGEKVLYTYKDRARTPIEFSSKDEAEKECIECEFDTANVITEDQLNYENGKYWIV